MTLGGTFATHNAYSRGYPDIVDALRDLVVLFMLALFFRFRSLLASFLQSVTLPTFEWEEKFQLRSLVVVIR